MDSSDASWLSQMGLSSSIFMDEECDFFMDSEIAAALGSEFDVGFSSGNNSDSSTTLVNNPSPNSVTSLEFHSPAPPVKIQKPNGFTDFSSFNPNPDRVSSASVILNFGRGTECSPPPSGAPVLNPEEEAAVTGVLKSPEGQLKKPTTPAKKPSRIRPPSQTYDHIIAERKRREQLSQRFVALSTIIPGLKKMDKTSVLGDAIKYLKHLQERVKILEEQATKQTMESVVLVKKSQIMAEEDEGSSDEKSSCTDETPLPEIEARVCNSHILIRIHCEKQKGVLVNLLNKVEKLNLGVVNTNVTSFGSLTVDITIVAEMEKEFNLTIKEVVRILRAAI